MTASRTWGDKGECFRREALRGSLTGQERAPYNPGGSLETQFRNIRIKELGK